MKLSKIKKELQNGTIAIEHTDLKSLKKVIKYFYPEDDVVSGFAKYYFSSLGNKNFWAYNNDFIGKSFKDVVLLKYIESEEAVTRVSEHFGADFPSNCTLLKITREIRNGTIAIEHTDLESLKKVLKYFYPEDVVIASGESKYYFSNYGNKKIWGGDDDFAGQSFKDVDLLKLIESKQKIMKLSKIKNQLQKGKTAIEHTDLESLTKVLNYFYPEDVVITSGGSKYYFSNYGNKKIWACGNDFVGKSFKDVVLLKLIEGITLSGKLTKRGMKLSKIKKELQKGTIAIEHTDLESLTKVLKYFYLKDDTITSGSYKYYYSCLGSKKIWGGVNDFVGKSFKDVDLLKLIESEEAVTRVSEHFGADFPSNYTIYKSQLKALTENFIKSNCTLSGKVTIVVEEKSCKFINSSGETEIIY